MLNRFAIDAVKTVVDCVRHDGWLANTLFKDGRWNFALAETWNIDFFGDVLEGVVKARLHVGRTCFDDELDAGRLNAFNGGFHEPSPEKARDASQAGF